MAKSAVRTGTKVRLAAKGALSFLILTSVNTQVPSLFDQLSFGILPVLEFAPVLTLEVKITQAKLKGFIMFPWNLQKTRQVRYTHICW